jgi:hypothetical protein
MILLGFLLGTGFQAHSQGHLLITPKRVVFEGGMQRAELNLMNTGSDTARYSISFRQYNMAEEGNLVLIEKPDTARMPSEPYLRIFPRQVVLPPGESQAVMLQCRRPAGMLPGEYRSHLWFRKEANYRELGKEQPILDSTRLSVSLTAVFGMTIPVIIRTGEVHAGATLSDLRLENPQDSVPQLKFLINRTGNISVYGNLVADFIPSHGKPYQIGILKGVGVYTNLNRRSVSMKLKNTTGAPLADGKIVVRYTSPDDVKYELQAEERLDLIR